MSKPPKDDFEKKPGNPMVVAMLGVLLAGNLVGTGVVAFKVMHAPKADAHAAAADPAPGEGPVVALDAFVVNLNEEGSTRFLKANFEVQVSNVRAQEDLTAHKRVVRDDVLRYLSSLAVSDTLGEANKSKIRDEVTARINKTLGGDRVHRVFFTEFVIQ